MTPGSFIKPNASIHPGVKQTRESFHFVLACVSESFTQFVSQA